MDSDEEELHDRFVALRAGIESAILGLEVSRLNSSDAPTTLSKQPRALSSERVKPPVPPHLSSEPVAAHLISEAALPGLMNAEEISLRSPDRFSPLAYLDALPEHVRRAKCPNVPQTSAGATRNGRFKLGEQEAAVGRVAGGCAPAAALTHPSSLSPGVRELFVDNATALTGGAFGHEAMRSAIRSHKQKYEEARAALRMRHPHARA
tara:strand:- start:215 stop:835 length:621 start_codon:yes stop_codon:yes gene_type:complete